MTVAIAPFGCATNIEYPSLKDGSTSVGPDVPNATIARLRGCVEEYGSELHGAGFVFHYQASTTGSSR
ncbi:hypothetical protein [Polyangium sp. y55x31]|uniref:hypothetical protein n=1 Tax=Polyangium sp. y55x31 TaxID=3042688 RepID=UPI002482D639|nr:hypothetical protein [Polyangium sp. y55x31]MDI1480154.1 hypothetical protein [Polyangium sp. y55x31]